MPEYKTITKQMSRVLVNHRFTVTILEIHDRANPHQESDLRGHGDSARKATTECTLR